MVAIFAFTKQCKLGCEHCFEGDALNGPDELSLAEAKAVLSTLLKSGVGQIVLSGGEPLNRFSDLIQLVEYLKDEPVDVWVNTSGLSLSLDRASRLKEAGLTGVAISLDDYRREYHERFRGQVGLFDRVESAFANARSVGLLTKATLCPVAGFITKENLERYLALVTSWSVDFLQLLEPRSVGRYADLKVELSEAHHKVLEQFFFDNCGSLRGTIRCPIVTYPDFERRRHGCLGGKRFLYVNTDGLASPCPFCQKNGRTLETMDWLNPFADRKCP
jgi:MoaA/NifB/PqqE/SkfB family radical SAM enzyme